jgi:hypothetical protein
MCNGNDTGNWVSSRTSWCDVVFVGETCFRFEINRHLIEVYEHLSYILCVRVYMCREVRGGFRDNLNFYI